MEKAKTIVYLFMSLIYACSPGEPDCAYKTPDFGYQFECPDHVYQLPEELTEISGLQLLGNNQMACVQDEDGLIYIYDLDKEKIDKRIQFSGHGDYEGIALADNDLYVLESNGRFHLINNFDPQDENIAVEVIKTDVNRKNNTEGICYDKENARLLLAFKDDPGNDLENKKAIYAFDLKSKKVTAAPVFTIDLKELAASLLEDDLSKIFYKLRKIFGSMTGSELFRPSGVAIHPVTHDIFIIDSENKLLAVLDKTGKLKHVYDFSSSLYIQPEGITFAANGDLYICNEGKDLQGNILTFIYDPKN